MRLGIAYQQGSVGPRKSHWPQILLAPSALKPTAPMFSVRPDGQSPNHPRVGITKVHKQDCHQIYNCKTLSQFQIRLLHRTIWALKKSPDYGISPRSGLSELGMRASINSRIPGSRHHLIPKMQMEPVITVTQGGDLIAGRIAADHDVARTRPSCANFCSTTANHRLRCKQCRVVAATHQGLIQAATVCGGIVGRVSAAREPSFMLGTQPK